MVVFSLKNVIWGWKIIKITIIKLFLMLSKPVFQIIVLLLQCRKELANSRHLRVNFTLSLKKRFLMVKVYGWLI